MKKENNSLINENVVRRWGKLANMAKLTENYLESTVEEAAHEDEEMEVEMPEAAEEMEMDAEMADDAEEMEMDAEMDMGEEPSLDLDEEEIEQVAQMFFDTLAKATGKEIDTEITSDEEEMDMDEDPAMAHDDPAMAHDDPAMAHDDPAMYDDKPANREDEETTEEETVAEETEVEVDVVDDESLTEAVLARVIERLLKTDK
jgi:hypothetical protein